MSWPWMAVSIGHGFVCKELMCYSVELFAWPWMTVSWPWISGCKAGYKGKAVYRFGLVSFRLGAFLVSLGVGRFGF